MNRRRGDGLLYAALRWAAGVVGTMAVGAAGWGVMATLDVHDRLRDLEHGQRFIRYWLRYKGILS